MKNKFLLIISLLSMSMVMNAKPVIQRVEPLCWWTEMNTPLTLLFQGEDLADAQVTVQEVVGNKVMRGQCLGLVPKAQHNAESPNYLFVDMDVKQAGTYRITITKNKKKALFINVFIDK